VKKQIPVTAVVAAALVLVVAAALFLLVKPRYDESGRLDAQIVDLEGQIEEASRPKAEVAEPTGPEIKVADLFRLAKAMPDSDDVAGIVLELDTLASASGVRLIAITPLAPSAAIGYRSLPITIAVDGSFFDVVDFLYRLRTLVSVRDGVLDASGRLYAVTAVDLHESPAGFPSVEGALTLSAYSYGTGGLLPLGAPAVPAAATPPAPATTTTETTTTETTTTEEGSTEGATTQDPEHSDGTQNNSQADGAQALGEDGGDS
jgi:hypothetical protein